MLHEARVTCPNCDEPILVTFVMVKRRTSDKAPHECPICDDGEAVAEVLLRAHDGNMHHPLLLSVRGDAGAPRSQARGVSNNLAKPLK